MLHFGNKLNEEVCRGFIFANLLIHYISRYGYDSSRQFGDYFSGFGRQSEKFSRTGACIRRNFTPWIINDSKIFAGNNGKSVPSSSASTPKV